MGKTKYSKEELIQQVQMLAEELGKTPTMIDFNYDPRVGSTSTVQRLFGSWNQFIEAAGLKTYEYRLDFTDQELFAQLKAIVEKQGKVPSQVEFCKDPSNAKITTIKEHFGGWDNFLLAAGFKPRRVYSRTIDNDTLIEQVQNLAIKLGKIPTTTEFSSNPDTASAATAINHFGTWSNFLQVAGVAKVVKK